MYTQDDNMRRFEITKSIIGGYEIRDYKNRNNYFVECDGETIGALIDALNMANPASKKKIIKMIENEI